MIDLRQLRYFVALAELRHFGRAAERLHITQPPLSRQIAALEAELGVRLLERHPRDVRVTVAGLRFLEDARAVLAAFDEACRNVRLVDRGELGALSVGFMMHAAHTILPPLARRFMAAHPGVQVTLREVLPHLLGEEVLAGRFDAGIMFAPGAVRGLASRPIFRESLCLAVHPAHELARRRRIGAAELRAEKFIAVLAEVAPSLRAVIEAWCQAAGFAPQVRLEAQLQQTIIRLVAENLGVALVPDSMRRVGITDVAFCALEAAPEIAHVVVWRAGNLNPVLPPFLAMAEDESAG